MGLSPSLYVGTTGVITHQTGLSVVSHNIANMNTVGFKGSRAHFENLISHNLATGLPSSNQVGQGSCVSSVLRDLNVGALETTTIGTDVAIGSPHGWFVLADSAGNIRYSRSGNFRFDAQGYLRNPQGLLVQGVPADAQSAAAFAPIKLTMNPDPQNPELTVAMSPGQPTNTVLFAANISSAAMDTAPSATSPMTALFDAWDATTATFPSGAYLSSMTLYDSIGAPHQVSLIFDPAKEVQNLTTGHRVMEFLLTCPPDEDGNPGTSTKKGILGAGTLTFSPEGNLLNMSIFQGTSDDPATWTSAPLDATGLPQLQVTFAGAQPQTMTLNLGIRDTQAPPAWTNPTATLASLGVNAQNLPALGSPSTGALAITSYNGSSATISQSQDGFGKGYLQNVVVQADGMVVGKYSNGQDLAISRLVLADFTNPQGLRSEGSNLFSAVPEAGGIQYDFAGNGRLGRVYGSTLEQSNVDLAEEFVAMILYQKGIEANAKVITTADQVIQTAIQTKRV